MIEEFGCAFTAAATPFLKDLVDARLATLDAEAGTAPLGFYAAARRCRHH